MQETVRDTATPPCMRPPPPPHSPPPRPLEDAERARKRLRQLREQERERDRKRQEALELESQIKLLAEKHMARLREAEEPSGAREELGRCEESILRARGQDLISRLETLDVHALKRLLCMDPQDALQVIRHSHTAARDV